MKSSMADFFTDVWKSIVGFLGSFNWIVDTLDILLVAFIIYSAIKLVRDSAPSSCSRVSSCCW